LTAWDELLDEFRALGGTADNIRLGHGEFGRGIFPIDQAKPIAVRIPDNLLIDVNDMVVAGGVPRVGPGAKAGEREKAWLDRYQAEFAWGGGGADEIRRMFEMAGALPAELRRGLLTQYNCGLWFKEPTEELIANRFFNARGINYRNEDFAAVIKDLTKGRGVDVVLDMVAGDYVPREIECMADDGRIAIIAVLGGATANINLATVLRRRLTITGSTLRPRSVEFKAAIAQRLREKVWPLIEAGRVKPMLFRRFPLADAAAAHALMESSQHVGKIVLDVTPQAGEVPNR